MEQMCSTRSTKGSGRCFAMGPVFASIMAIILSGFLVYSNSLNGAFIWDDDILIRNNDYIKDWFHPGEIFREDIGAGSGVKYGYYRPLYILTFVLDYSLWGLNVGGYHLTNIVLHILVALSVYWLATLLYGNKTLSLFTGLLFVLHPIHTEVVTYISGRDNSLVALFMLLCCILYLKSLPTPRRTFWVLMFLSYTLALLSRENALIVPGLVLAYHYVFRKKIEARVFLSLIGVTFIYVLSVLYLLPSSSLKSVLVPPLWVGTVYKRLPGFFVAVANYVRLLILPFHQHIEYGDRVFGYADPRVLLGFMITVLLLMCAVRKRNSSPLLSFAVLWFFVALLPSCNLYTSQQNYMAERYLYLPSIGFFLLVGKSVVWISRKKEGKFFAVALMVGLSVFYACLTVRQNEYWREPVSFYTRTLHYTPDSARAYNNLGNVYAETGRYEEAIALHRKAIVLRPHYAQAYYNLGNEYVEVGEKKLAVAAYKKATEINPDYAKAHNNLGIVYGSLGKREEAIAQFQKAVEINPRFALAHNNLAVAYYSIGEYDLAVKHCDRATELGLRVHPGFREFLERYRGQRE